MDTTRPSSPPPPRGRGARSNASGRFESETRHAADDGWGEPAAPAQATTRLETLTARTALTYNTSPDLHFDRTINPYKGCEHGCIYCYARPNHAFLGLSPGLDFETRIFWKPDLAARLKAQLAKPGYRPAPVVIGGDTDPYQPAEREIGATRAALEVLAAARHPLALVTKSALVTRDLDILGPMAAQGLAKVAVSVTTLDRGLARAMEPRAAAPARRLDAIAALAGAGVPTRVMVAPIVPGLTDHEIEAVCARAADAGAREAGWVLLRLPGEVKDLFEEWLTAARPARAARVMRLVRDTRGGAAYDATFFTRGRGQGPIAALIARRVAAAAKRCGLETTSPPLRVDLFQAPRADGQGDLFAGPGDDAEDAA